MGTRTLAAVFAIALLQTASTAHAEDCRLIQLASFDIAPSDVAVIPVLINEREKKFLVDTGGVFSTISPAVVQELDLSQHHMLNGVEAYMADGTVIDHFVWVDALHLGVGTAKEVPLVVQPQQSRTGIETFDGTLAPDLLPNFDLDFDFGHNKLNLMAPMHCPDAVVYWADTFAEIPFEFDRNRHIVITATLDGLKLPATVDTGASHTTMSESMARSRFGFSEAKLPPLPPGANDNALLHYSSRFQTLDLNGVTVHNAEIVIMPDEMANSVLKHHHSVSDVDAANAALQSTPIIIGMNVLRKLHLYIDYKAKKIYITDAAATHGAAAPSATPAATASTQPSPQ